MEENFFKRMSYFLYLQLSIVSRARHISNSFLEHMLHCVKSSMNFFFEESFCQGTIYFLSFKAFHYANMIFCLFSLDVVKNGGYFWVDSAPIVVPEFRIVVFHLEAALAVVEYVV